MKNFNILKWEKRGEIEKKEKYKVIEHIHRFMEKGLNVVIAELNQGRQGKTTKFKRCDQRIEQYRINILFQQDRKESTNNGMKSLTAGKS